MKVRIVGAGMGNLRLLTGQALDAIENCELLLGARRMLDLFPQVKAEKIAVALPEKIAEILRENETHIKIATVLVSGDTGFYSAARTLPTLLSGMEVEFLCGVSSLSYFCAKLGTSWDDVTVVSLHGREQNLLNAVRISKKVFVLTGGENSVSAICELLAENNFEHLRVAVGENLSCDEEQITLGDAASFSKREFSPLSVMMLFNISPETVPATHGMSDNCFIRGETPMTKAEVRAVALAKLELKQGQILWDIGAGTGSISVEAARVLRDGHVYAVERDSEALELLRLNREKFACRNLHISPGTAPGALAPLPAPDAVFVGGSSGNLRRIIAIALEKNPHVRIVVNAITLETVVATLECFAQFSLPDRDLVQVSITKARIGNVHMLLAENPVFIMSGGGEHD